MPKRNPDNPEISPEDEKELDALHVLERLNRLGSVAAVQAELNWPIETIQSRFRNLRNRYKDDLYEVDKRSNFGGVTGFTPKGEALCEDYLVFIKRRNAYMEVVANFSKRKNLSKKLSNPSLGQDGMDDAGEEKG